VRRNCGPHGWIRRAARKEGVKRNYSTKSALEASLASVIRQLIRAETLRAEIERLEAARAAMSRRSKYGAIKPWTQNGVSQGTWYRRLLEGRAFDARYRPRAPWRRHLPLRPVNGGAEVVQ
jgi:hypothetical protein